jgi:transposase
MKRVLDERLWRRAERLLPKAPPRPRGGRPRASDRACLEGILYSLRTGCPWEYLPKELGVSGMTCWRRLRDWHAAGVWAKLHASLLDALGREGVVDWSRASVDSASVPAKRGARRRAPAPSTVASQAPSAT